MDNIRYRTFNVDTNGRLPKADGWKITAATEKFGGKFSYALSFKNKKDKTNKQVGQHLAFKRLVWAGESLDIGIDAFVLDNEKFTISECLKNKIINNLKNRKRRIFALEGITKDDLK